VVVIGAAGASARSPLQFLAIVAFGSRRQTGGCKRSIVLASACASEIVERNEFAGPAKTLAKSALRGCYRFRRFDHAHRRARDDAPRPGGGGLWMGRRHGFADLGRAIYSGRCFAVRHRVGHVSDCRSANRMRTSGEQA
jgi:hypothetical protein